MLIHVGLKAEEFADAPVEVADGIGRILFVFQRHVRAARLPAGAAAEIAAAIQRQHGGLFEGRRIVAFQSLPMVSGDRSMVSPVASTKYFPGGKVGLDHAPA